MSRWIFSAACSAIRPSTSCASAPRIRARSSGANSTSRSRGVNSGTVAAFTDGEPNDARPLDAARRAGAGAGVDAGRTQSPKLAPSISSIVKNQSRPSENSSPSEIRLGCARSRKSRNSFLKRNRPSAESERSVLSATGA